MTNQSPIPLYRPFHLDRTVTMGLVFTLLAQTAGGLIWVGSAASRLSALESQQASNPQISERLARLEGQTSEMTKSLSRIERELMRDE
ncbi:MAG: hypothetical protein ABJO36_07075 [Litorimonas sp.]